MATLDPNYKEAVETYARERRNYLFHNMGNDHALVIFTNIFETAESDIRIAAAKLCNQEVVNTEEYISSMSKFLARPDAKLKIIVSEFSKEEVESIKVNNFFRFLYDSDAYKEGRVEIHTGEGKNFKGNDGRLINFCAADSRMFRFEDDIVNRRATCNFNDEDSAKTLEDVFDHVFETLDAVNLHDCFDNVA